MLKHFLICTTAILIVSGTAAAELVDNGDGTVTDTVSGLMWQKTTAEKRPWSTALIYCEDLMLAGYDDWRLPNRNELQSIVNYNNSNPAIDPDMFPEVDAMTDTEKFWTASTHVRNPENAWIVAFDSGGLSYDNKSASLHVRAVRTVQQ